MKCVFLGTGSSIITARRHNTSLFLQREERGLLIDCNGLCVRRLNETGFAFETLEYVFLTHEHIDHIGALLGLLHQIWLKSCYYRPENRRVAPIHFYANTSTLRTVRALFDAVQLLQSPYIFPFEFHELESSGGQVEINGFDLTYFPVRHGATPCFGIAAQGDAGTLVYSADTEPAPMIYTHLKDGDTLIHECNVIDAPLSAGHTTWQQLHGLLPSLPDMRIYLVHLPAMEDAIEAEWTVILQKAGKITFAIDGLVIEV